MLNIFCFTGGIVQTNGFLVQLPDGSVLAIDAPEGMADWVEAQGLRVSHIILTHQHFDHVMDAATLKARHGAKIYAFAPFSRELTLERLFSFAVGSSIEVPEYAVDEVLRDQKSLVTGETTWDMEHIPGHSTDSLVFISQEHRLVFGGDVLFADGIGRSDFPGGNFQLLLMGIRGKLLPLPDDFTLYTGHGPETTIGDERLGNPYVKAGSRV